MNLVKHSSKITVKSSITQLRNKSSLNTPHQIQQFVLEASRKSWDPKMYSRAVTSETQAKSLTLEKLQQLADLSKIKLPHNPEALLKSVNQQLQFLDQVQLFKGEATREHVDQEGMCLSDLEARVEQFNQSEDCDRGESCDWNPARLSSMSEGRFYVVKEGEES